LFVWVGFIDLAELEGSPSSGLLDRNHKIQLPLAPGKEEHGVEKSDTG